MTSDPVSWLMIEPGWRVESADGEDVGRVEEVAGDSGADIFDGLAIAFHFLGRQHYVPAEQVGEITDGTVRLQLDRQTIEQLPEYKEPAVEEQISGEKAGIFARAETRVEHPHTHEYRTGIVRRALEWLGLAGRR